MVPSFTTAISYNNYIIITICFISVGITDKPITVGFFNGKTLQIPTNIALWIPPDLYERVSFEIKLPAKVRMEMAENVSEYPCQTMPGYPSSATVRNPVVIEGYSPVVIESAPGYWERGMYRGRPGFVPLYKQKGQCFNPPPGFVDSDVLIPGTEMTESQLNEKVMSQIMAHKMTLGEDKDRLLSRRENIEGSHIRKSVSFDNTHLSDVEAEFDETEMKDSGRGSATDLGLSEDELDKLLAEEELKTAELEENLVRTESRLR